MSKKNTVGNYILIFGIFLLFTLNLNYYDWYIRMRSANYLLVSAIVTALFICYADFKTLLKDKFFILLVVTNVLAIVSVCVSGIYNCSCLTVYIVTMALFISDKVRLTGKQFVPIACFIAVFSVYWTIDVKGYYKGYSINFGGLVILSGFIFFMLVLEYVKYWIINHDLSLGNYESSAEENGDAIYVIVIASIVRFFKRFPFLITFIEIIRFAIAFKIIAYYQSRTGAAVLIAFAVLLLLPRKILYKKGVGTSLVLLAFFVMCFLPIVYIVIARLGIMSESIVFYRPLIGQRATNWAVLYKLVLEKILLGNGSLIVGPGSTFREGFVDACNAPLQIAVMYGGIVAVLTLLMLFIALCRQAKRISNPYMASAFICIIAFIIGSGSETFVFNPIFAVPFLTMIIIFYSLQGAHDSEKTVDMLDAYKMIFSSEYKEKYNPAFCATAMLLIMYLILGPLEIFYSNYLEFEFNTSAFIYYFIGIGLLILYVVPLVVCMFPKKVSEIYCAICLGIGVSSYIQYMFLNLTLSNIDGKPDFSSGIGVKYYISVVLFVLCILVLIVLSQFILKKSMTKVVTYSSLGLSVVMLTAVVTVGIGLLGLENKAPYGVVFDATDEYEFGSKENTIVIILDTFGRDDLESELSEHPEMIDALSDFTYYDREDSVYAPTFPSLVHMLTEYEYNGEERAEFEKTAFTSNSAKSFFDSVKNAGYDTNIYTRDILTGEYMEYIASNVKESRREVNKKLVRSRLLKLSIYRYVPYCFKEYFYVENPNYYTVDYDITIPDVFNYDHYRNITEREFCFSEGIDKKLKIHHFYGMHTTFLNDEYAMKVDTYEPTRWQTMTGLMLILDTYFNKLKELGIYDNSTIIVLSDHGRMYDRTGYDHFYTDSIFFEKKPGESHSAAVRNHEELTHHDFQKIIIDSLR